MNKQAGGNVLGNLGSNCHSLISAMILVRHMLKILVLSSFRGTLKQRILREWNFRCLETRVARVQGNIEITSYLVRGGQVSVKFHRSSD